MTQLRPMKGEMVGEVVFWKRGSSLLFPGNFQKGPTLFFWLHGVSVWGVKDKGNTGGEQRRKEVREMEPG